MKKIAFIGLGNMGKPMALNLVKGQLPVTAFDLNTQAVKDLREAGAAAAGSVAEAVQGAELVITMLPASKHVADVYLGSGKLLASAPPTALLIDSSTIAPAVAKEVHAAASTRGFAMIDAPVSGGTAGAAAGTLTFMVGGEKAAFEKAKPFLEKMGKNIFHAGPAGCGQIAKVCNNMLLAIHMIGTSEALNLGVACGMDPKVLSEIMSKSSGRNWSLEVYNPFPGVHEQAPASRGYTGGFMVDLMAKDLGLAKEAATQTQTATPLGSHAAEFYRLLARQGLGAKDFSYVLQFLKGI